MKVYVISGAILATIGFASCQRKFENNPSTSSIKEDEIVEAQDSDDLEAKKAETEGFQSFAFYEGIPANGKRSLSRSDGTIHGMPCITKAVIAKGEEAKYDFWHGHNRELHRFVLSVDDLAKLKEGKSIEVFTAVVDGHKHAVKIDLEKSCKVKAGE